MTTVYERNPAAEPGVHILAIGVGRYPYLIGGSGRLTNNPLGLAQLSSPPVSVKAVIDWFLASVVAPGTGGFANPVTLLGSIEGLASSDAPVSVTSAGGVIQLEAATKANIQDAFERWLARLTSHDANIGVFYFCGHGVMVADHYLLAEDFGQSNAVPWERAFDISNTLRAVERDAKGALYFFVDACRQSSCPQSS
jgi:hypothetical protein